MGHHVSLLLTQRPSLLWSFLVKSKKENHPPVSGSRPLFMAIIQLIHACTLLLAVITYHHIFYIQARPIKSLSSIDLDPGSDQHKSGHPYPDSIPSVKKSVSGKEIPPPNSAGFGDSIEAHEDGFRPTTPGSSPGVGHSSAPTREEIKNRAPAIKGWLEKYRHSLSTGLQPWYCSPLSSEYILCISLYGLLNCTEALLRVSQQILSFNVKLMIMYH